MKPLQPYIVTSILLASIFSHQYCCAQQDGNNPKNFTPAEMRSSLTPANYTFRLLHLTGYTPGYVVLNNDKPVYVFKGTPITIQANENNLLTLRKQQDIEKAALLSIDKIKRRQNPALTGDEIQQVIINKQNTTATN